MKHWIIAATIVLLTGMACAGPCAGEPDWAGDYFRRMAAPRPGAFLGKQSMAGSVSPGEKVKYRFRLDDSWAGADGIGEKFGENLKPMMKEERDKFGEALANFKYKRENYMFDLIFSERPLEMQYEMLKRLLIKRGGTKD